MNRASPEEAGQLEPPRGLWRRMEALRTRGMRSRNLFWSREVSYRIGALITLTVVRTPITPNLLTLAGFIATAGGAGLVWAAGGESSPTLAVAVVLLWQLGVAFDCADGLLARERARSSPFGAWIDQVTDFVGHTLVGAVLVDFSVRALQLDTGQAIGLAVAVIGASTLQIFAAAQRDLIFGASAVRSALAGRRAVLGSLADLVDYALFLLLAGALLAAPDALLAYLLVATALSLGFVAGQAVVLRGRPSA